MGREAVNANDARSEVACPVCGRPGNCCQARDELERLRWEKAEWEWALGELQTTQREVERLRDAARS